MERERLSRKISFLRGGWWVMGGRLFDDDIVNIKESILPRHPRFLFIHHV